MKFHCSTLKAQARQAMHTARPGALPMTLLYLLLTTGLTILIGFFFPDPLSTLANFILAGLSIPLSASLTLAKVGSIGLFLYFLVLFSGAVLGFGYGWWCLGTTRGGIGQWRDLTGGFPLVGRVLLLRLIVLTYSIFWALIISYLAMLLIPFVLYITGLGPLAMDLVILVAGFLFIWKILSYELADCCLMDAPDKGPFFAVYESRRLMRKHRKQYLLLALSFLGWVVLYLVIESIVLAVLVLLLAGPQLLAGDILANLNAVLSAYPWINVIPALLCLPLLALLTAYRAMAKCRFYDLVRSAQ